MRHQLSVFNQQKVAVHHQITKYQDRKEITIFKAIWQKVRSSQQNKVCNYWRKKWIVQEWVDKNHPPKVAKTFLCSKKPAAIQIRWKRSNSQTLIKIFNHFNLQRLNIPLTLLKIMSNNNNHIMQHMSQKVTKRLS